MGHAGTSRGQVTWYLKIPVSFQVQGNVLGVQAIRLVGRGWEGGSEHTTHGTRHTTHDTHNVAHEPT
jgi:hypothetical protein